MPFPSPNGFGIIDNPLVYGPFTEGYSPPGPSDLDFLLMDSEFFLLMDGSNFLSFTP